MAISNPPPKATPFIAARDGLPKFSRREIFFWALEAKRYPLAEFKSASCLISAPAQKA
jgi:hypothetical protein